MRRTKTVLVAVLFVLLLTPHFVNAAPKEESTEPVIFNKKATLPGGIKVDYSIVSLPQYKSEVNKVFEYSFTEIKKVVEAVDGANKSNDLTKVEELAGTEAAPVSRETLALAEHAKQIAEWTHGAYDPVKGDGDYKNLKIDKKNSTLKLTKPDLTIDFNDIVEGFVADLFIRAASAASIENAFIEIDGVRRALGRASFGPWTIQIEGSGDKYAKHGRQLTLSNYSAATVGKAVPDSPYYSVTVLTKEAATSQGVANSLFSLGEKEGQDLVNALGVKAILAFKDGSMKQIGKW